MCTNKFIAIYYFSNTNSYDSNLRLHFQKQGVELTYETNLSRLLSKTVLLHPMMLVVDKIPLDFFDQFSDLFGMESPFYVPSVCFLQDIKELKNPNIPYNYLMCGSKNYEQVLNTKICECLTYKNNPQSITNFPITRFEDITNVLVGLGINSKSSGLVFLKDCINQIIIDGCKACTLYGSVYRVVATMHSTTINNMERCMRTSINKAWKSYSLHSKSNLPQKPSLDLLFASKPTVKEFIYFVANYIKDKECENRLNSMVFGMSQRVAL